MSATADELRTQLQGRRKKPAAPAWCPPRVTDFRGWMPVLAWDATLSHCGWVAGERRHDEVIIHGKGTIHLKTDLTGYLGTWEKARLLRHRLREVLPAYPGWRTVVEAPAVRGSRLESSLIAGLLIFLETEKPTGLACAQISATHVSAVLCGNARLKSADRKKAVRAACARYVPPSDSHAWNEHERDALAVLLTDLLDTQIHTHESLLRSFT